MKRLVFLILFLTVLVQMNAQVRFNVSFEKDTVALGEVNNLTIEVVTPSPNWIKGYNLTNFNEIKPKVSFYEDDRLDLVTNAEFEFLDINTELPVLLTGPNFERRADGMFVHKNSTRFVAWDIGVFQFPDLDIQFDTVGNRRYNVMPLEVSSLYVDAPIGAVNVQEGESIAPIVPIMKENMELQDALWFVYLNLFAFLMVAVLLYFLRQKKRAKKAAEAARVVIRDAHEVAYEKLDDLDKKQLWQQGKIKEYQSELTYTVREYLENRFGIQALESTTGEINRSLKEVDFDQNHTSDLNNILQIADMVKFAKAEPEESVHQDFMNKARSFVKETLLIKKVDEDGLVE